jgi:hypothetical protein
MTCEQARQHFAAELTGRLDVEERREYDAHLAACASCREEAAALQNVWNRLDLLPEPEPGPDMRSRFYGMLEAYQQGVNERERPKRRAWLHWWPTQPAMQFGLSAALLLIGFAVGHGVFTPAETGRELAQLRGEVSGMRQLVTLSLLQQQSASERLKGVSWSYQVPQSDTEVLAALLQTVNQDASVNVRLAAVDALRQFGKSPVMRKGVVNSLAKQSSPLVQIGVIDLLVELNEKPAIPALNRLLESSDLDPNVSHRAKWAVQQLS